MYKALQGNLGLGKAIAYFVSHQYPVSIPLNDTQKYDLVVEIDGALKRISVKTSQQNRYENSYSIQLRNCGGASGKSVVRPFDNQTCDYVFIYTADERIFLIPSNIISAKNCISVGNKYTEYEVFISSFQDFIHGEVDPSGAGPAPEKQ